MLKKITPLKFVCLFSTLLLVSYFTNAQGLENVIVERYYVSDAADSVGNDLVAASPGRLPVGSVTYRVYADMLPGYKFQVLYGVNTLGGEHELRIETSTNFFNNEDRGATTPNGITVNQTKGNTVMLDSWFSVGATASTKVGVLKTEDTDGSIGNTDGLLQNTDVTAGIPIKTQDGMIPGTYSAVTFVGLSTELDIFDAGGTIGGLFSTSNGSVACLVGAVGTTADNRVLLGQFTTDGIFSFELNIQIGTPTGGVENYVAKNPVGNEILMTTLIYPNSVNTPTVENPSASFIVYPNPAKDLLTIDITPTEKSISNSYAIYSVYGNMILQKNLGVISGKQSEKVDMSSLAQGIYILALTSDGITSAKQIIKQ